MPYIKICIYKIKRYERKFKNFNLYKNLLDIINFLYTFVK